MGGNIGKMGLVPMVRLGLGIAAIQRIEAAGGEVMYGRADVTNPEAIRRVVADAKTRFGAIDGVIHAAGLVKDDLIALKSPSDVEDVFAPKVLGTMVLDEVLRSEPIELVVLFSSTSTDIGARFLRGDEARLREFGWL